MLAVVAPRLTAFHAARAVVHPVITYKNINQTIIFPNERVSVTLKVVVIFLAGFEWTFFHVFIRVPDENRRGAIIC